MKKFVALVAMMLLLSGCSGLPYPREMGDMALLRTMGVDREGEGLSMTVSTGPRAKGGNGEQEPPLVLSSTALSLSGASLALQGLSEDYVFFGYVDQLLLGEELARQGVTTVLDYFARDVELGLGAQLWVVKGDEAKTAVESGGEQGVEQRLSTLQTDAEMGVAANARTAGDVYCDLLEQGSAYVPALLPAQGEQGMLMESGYAVLKEDRVVGFLEGDLARGLELLSGKPAQEVLQVDLPRGRVSVRITAAVTAGKLLTRGEQVTGLEVDCRLIAQLAEYQTPLSREERELLGELVEQREQQRLEQALSQLQQWGTDCAGLGPRAALRSPGVWQEVQQSWPQTFAGLLPQWNVRAVIHD